jgi:hypothetical protein
LIEETLGGESGTKLQADAEDGTITTVQKEKTALETLSVVGRRAILTTWELALERPTWRLCVAKMATAAVPVPMDGSSLMLSGYSLARIQLTKGFNPYFQVEQM